MEKVILPDTFTAQELFSFVKARLMEQGAKSQGNDGSCMYRCGTRKCAAGHVISDEEYVPSMEAVSIEGILHRDTTPASLKKRVGEHERLIAQLQKLHDSFYPPQWGDEFARISKIFHLQNI